MENTEPPVVTGNPAHTDDGKTIAIVCYLTIIGWVIALVMHGNKKTQLGAFHLRQTIALFIIGICTSIVQILLAFIPYLGWLLDVLLILIYIALFSEWVIGFIAALNGQEKPIPVIGENAQNWFHGLG